MNPKKIRKFNELMDPELATELGLLKHLVNEDDEDYFFDFKTINRIYDEDIIKVIVYDVRVEGEQLYFRTKITIHKTSFDIYIITDFSNNVEFATDKGEAYMHRFEKILKPELVYFVDMFEDIYRDIIPEDYWEVKSNVN
jgi:hypothetical protein